MCEECFALLEECECEFDDDLVDVDIHGNNVDEPKRKSKGKWEPNISKNEKWENVTSPYKKYNEGV